MLYLKGSWVGILLIGRFGRTVAQDSIDREINRFTSITWEEFLEAFMARFLPTSGRVDLAIKIESLKQMLGVSAIGYVTQFTQLSHYAP